MSQHVRVHIPDLRKAGARRLAIELLPAAIEQLLEAAGHTVLELTRVLGYSERAIRPRLEQLQLDHRAHRVRVKLRNAPGVCYRWHAGAAPDAAEEVPVVTPDLRTRQRLGLPIQTTVREYPAVNRRDPLVAALHGPAGQVMP